MKLETQTIVTLALAGFSAPEIDKLARISRPPRESR